MFEELKIWEVEYILLVKKVDLFLIVLVSVNVIGKIVNGIVDDMLIIIVMVIKV